MAQSIPLEDFSRSFGAGVTEVSSDSLGGKIVSVSDEWFAEAKCLLRQGPAQSLKGQFGPNGALFDGWESRRHNPTYDWVIIRLGVPSATLVGFDIDTANFNGNESPESAVYGLYRPDADAPDPTEPDTEWEELLPVAPLGPSSRHLFTIPLTKRSYTHLKLLMIPDGGIARFRAYGHVVPIFPSDPLTPVDLAGALNGGKVVFTSDQHFGEGKNVILPGRGPASMAEGWETSRSRVKGHSDHVIVQLGAPGYLEYAEVDTNYFIGNYPQGVDLFGTVSKTDLPPKDAKWVEILPRSKLGPHRQQYFQLSRPEVSFTHVRMTIYPDGGVKRIRLVGRRSTGSENPPHRTHPIAVPEAASLSAHSPTVQTVPNGISSTTTNNAPRIPILPLTPEAFAPFGQVLQAYDDLRACPKEIKVKRVNFGTANKFNHLAPVTFLPPPPGKWSTPEGKAGKLKGEINFCVFSSEAQNGALDPKTGREEWPLKALERHEFSSQAFSPFGGGGSRYLVVVALPAKDGNPDLATLRAYFATSRQGITYNPNIWHHPLIALDKPTDFACVVTETDDPAVDCEIIQYEAPIAFLEGVSSV